MEAAVMNYEALLAENTRLREEVRRLRLELGMYHENEDQSSASPNNYSPNRPKATACAIVHKGSGTDEKVTLFMSLFRGRNDVYAKRYFNIKTGQCGYVPACQNEWVRGVCDKKKYRCGMCPNRLFIPLRRDTVYQHLSGNQPNACDVIGLYPMTDDECCYFLAIDFDGENWKDDIASFRLSCEELCVPLVVERSRSGNGGHVWFFFDDKIPAGTARCLGSALLTRAMSRRHEIRFKSYSRCRARPISA